MDIEKEITKIENSLNAIENSLNAIKNRLNSTENIQDYKYYTYLDSQNTVMAIPGSSSKINGLKLTHNLFPLQANLDKLKKINIINNKLMQIAVELDPERLGEFIPGKENYCVLIDGKETSVSKITGRGCLHVVFYSKLEIAEKARKIISDMLFWIT